MNLEDLREMVRAEDRYCWEVLICGRDNVYLCRLPSGLGGVWVLGYEDGVGRIQLETFKLRRDALIRVAAVLKESALLRDAAINRVDGSPTIVYMVEAERESNGLFVPRRGAERTICPLSFARLESGLGLRILDLQASQPEGADFPDGLVRWAWATDRQGREYILGLVDDYEKFRLNED